MTDLRLPGCLGPPRFRLPPLVPPPKPALNSVRTSALWVVGRRAEAGGADDITGTLNKSHFYAFGGENDCFMRFLRPYGFLKILLRKKNRWRNAHVCEGEFESADE